VQLKGKLPGYGIKKGDVKYAGHTWYWHQETLKTADDGFRSINIRVFNREESEDALADLTSYMVKKS